MDILIGKTLGAYHILNPIGKGGMGCVYEAKAPSREEHVAIKILFPVLAQDENFKARFQRELQVLSKLKHPHIVPLVDFGRFEDTAYLVMPFMESGTLETRLKQGPLTLQEAARLMKQVCAALEYAHLAGVVHRDVKPSNILIDKDGNAMLSDFGLAHIMDSSMSLTGSAIIGTPSFMAPEQCKGEAVDARSDQYSLAVILYRLSTGSLPFNAETPLGVVIKQVSEPLPLPRMVNPNLPEAVERVLLKALAKDPDQRFGSIADFDRAFRSALIHAVRASRERRWWRRIRMPEALKPRHSPASPGYAQSDRRHPWRRLIPALALLLLTLACALSGSRLSVPMPELGLFGGGWDNAPAAQVASVQSASGLGLLASGEWTPQPTAFVVQPSASSDINPWRSPSATASPGPGLTAPTMTDEFRSPTASQVTIHRPTATTNFASSTPTEPPGHTATWTATSRPSIAPSLTPTSTATPQLSSPSPTGTPTSPPASPTATQAQETDTVPGCPAFYFSVSQAGEYVTWKIRNDYGEAIKLVSLTFNWPQENGTVDQIRMGPVGGVKKIHDDDWYTAPTVISSGWVGMGKYRMIDPGEWSYLVFDFFREPASSGYQIEAIFDNGCAVQAEE
jgi:serine/threonine protein kinase